jgi:diguanylate cyclase (GGDEF)-like protein
VSLPQLPGSPSVTVNPGGQGGVTLDVGVADEALHVGAGPGGVSVNRSARSASPGGGESGGDQPVSTPGDRPGDGRSVPPATNTGGGSLLVDPSPVADTGLAARSARDGTQPESTPRTSTVASREGGPPPPPKRSRLPPFIAFVEKIPDFVKVGVAALTLVAIAVWFGWVRARRRLTHNAFVDPVTGLANAPAFDGLLARELDRARRYKRPLALVLLDVSEVRPTMLLPLLDHNLREVTRAIQDPTRESDIVARLGQSRFAIICPEATAAAAETLARALELRLEEMRLHAVSGTAERLATDTEPGHLEARAEERMGASIGPESTARIGPALRAA